MTLISSKSYPNSNNTFSFFITIYKKKSCFKPMDKIFQKDVIYILYSYEAEFIQ